VVVAQNNIPPAVRSNNETTVYDVGENENPFFPVGIKTVGCAESSTHVV
jgi:hypothetical protein